MLKQSGRMLRGLMGGDRSRWMVAGSSVVLAMAALLPWSKVPSAAQSFQGPSGELILLETPHWTEIAARSAAFAGGLFFLWVALKRKAPGSGILRLASCLVAFLFAYPCWLNHFAPQHHFERRLLYQQMKRVVDEMERNSAEQQVNWRGWQRFSGVFLGSAAAEQDTEESWKITLLT